MKRHLMLNVDTVENNGLLVHDKVNPLKRYVFVDPHSFYKWLCSEMEVNSKSDSHTTDGRVVIDWKKLDRLYRIEEEAKVVMSVRGWASWFPALAEALK